MEPRTLRTTTAWLVALVSVLVPAAVVVPAAGAAVAADAPSPWTRPVAGRVVRPFVAPRSRYGAGHRGADLAALPGTPVLAVGTGRVTFAGPVAGTLHVVVEHADGLKTSVSFLATVAVRRGQTVRAGDGLGTAGGSGPDHDVGVVHLALRVRGEYVDPMQLFAAVDLTKAVHLAPLRHRPPQHGLDPPAAEARDLAHSLHLPQRIPGLEPAPSPGLWDRATGAVGATFSGAVAVDEYLGRPLVATWTTVAKYTPLGAGIDDLRSVASRLAAYVRSRSECSDDTAPGAGGGGSGHLLFAVGGIDSHTDAATGATFDLDTHALGYHSDEVAWFSYAPTGGAYTRRDTYTDLVGQAARMRDQLRAYGRANRGREVDLVAHSQGGVVVDAFLALYFDPADPTLPPLGNVVTLSSPHRGAPAAQVAADIRSSPNGRRLLDAVDDLAGGAIPPTGGPSTRQLAPDSGLMRRLRRAAMPDHIDFTSIGATDDAVVPPTATDKAGARSVMTNPSGLGDHSAVVRDPQSMTATRLALEMRPPACVGWLEGVRGAVEPVIVRRVEISLGHAAARAVDPPLVPSPVPLAGSLRHGGP